ncbi:glucose-6-phosphate dehydrogenase assembly protein OpcA [Rhizocola hellebori]|uniref:Glucose-6-phosphate dehydrogenase assembly protein OpcA n=1 Tax=Rhizocola hellebori TaxID=1392758 RepID=A0A8J3Q6Q7_9ACTN|nr:glucose-6-phosphate dehydrogenase assembly protein OpcA [Rhizocola hellebori]GIH05073.1 glucose-6-phosphate dehydrogenase assembly protein OpcA [Rhizocola hellebori]
MLALWDTKGSEVVKKLAAERRNTGGGASGLALTVVAIVDDARIREVEEAATIAASAHPCRLLVISRGPVSGPDPETANAKDRLDAEIIVGGRLGPCEAVIMRMHGRLALHAESIVMPLLAPDVPVVTWWHGPPPERLAFDPLGVVAERRVTDISQCADPAASLMQRAVDYAPGDTDLAWTRLTGWRALLASALDTGSTEVRDAMVTGSVQDPGTALLRGWLTSRLGIGTRLAEAPALTAVELELADGSHIGVRTLGDGTALVSRTGVGDRILPLIKRRLGDDLAEELRRLDPDQPYGWALQAATGIADLNDRPAVRTHVWQDPALVGVRR